MPPKKFKVGQRVVVTTGDYAGEEAVVTWVGNGGVTVKTDSSFLVHLADASVKTKEKKTMLSLCECQLCKDEYANLQDAIDNAVHEFGSAIEGPKDYIIVLSDYYLGKFDKRRFSFLDERLGSTWGYQEFSLVNGRICQGSPGEYKLRKNYRGRVVQKEFLESALDSLQKADDSLSAPVFRGRAIIENDED